MSQYFDNKELFLGPKVTQYGSHMVMTQVQKEMKKKYWNIDTQFRDDYDSYYDACFNNVTQYTFSLPQAINDVKSICVMNVELPITFYNISASIGNNMFKITHNSTYYYIVIPDGNYDTAGITSAINSQLANQGFSPTDISFAIYNGGYSKFTFNSGGGTYTFDFAVKRNITSSMHTTTMNNDFDKYTVKNKLGWLLGFRNITYTASTGSLQSEQLLDLNRIHYFYLVVDEFSVITPNSFISPFATSILNKNILAKISLDEKVYPFGTVLPANYSNGHLQSDKRTYAGKINLQRLKVQLVNEYGTPINLNGSDFSFCLEIEYE
jgi:hypothetical protein